MNKQEAINKLKEHGIELVYVTKRPSFFEDAYNDAHRDYQEAFEMGECSSYNDEAIIPTDKQYDKIIEIIGERGIYAIMDEHVRTKIFRLWTSTMRHNSRCWFLYFRQINPNHAFYSDEDKDLGISVALWTFEETKEEKIKRLEDENEKLKKQIEKLEKEVKELLPF